MSTTLQRRVFRLESNAGFDGDMRVIQPDGSAKVVDSLAYTLANLPPTLGPPSERVPADDKPKGIWVKPGEKLAQARQRGGEDCVLLEPLGRTSLDELLQALNT